MIVTAVLSIAVTLAVWQTAKIAERSHIHRMVQLAATAIREDFVSDNESWVLGVVRLASLWKSEDGPSYSEWKSIAELYIQHHPGCVAVAWVQPSFDEQWVILVEGEEKPSLAAQNTNNLLEEARRSGNPRMGYVQDEKGSRTRRTIAVPIFRREQFKGFVIVLIDVNQAYAAMLSDVASLGYSMCVRERGREIYTMEGSTTENEDLWARTYDVHLAGTTQSVVVWPKPGVLHEMSSRLPQATLLFGALLCVLLTFTVYLAQKAGTKSVRLHRTNLQLQLSVSEQHRIADALRSSQTRLAGILEISADAVISVDENFHITLFNQGAERMFGYRQHEILGRHLDVLLPERFRDIHHRHTAGFAGSEQPTLLMSERKSVFGRRRDGTEFPIEASLAKLKLQEGTVFTAIVRDITERVRAQEDLQRSHEGLETRVLERTAELQELSNRIVHLQDEERRRLARELHDGTTQTLIAIGMDVSTLTRLLSEAEPRVRTKLAECKELVSQCMNEIRTVSYLLHPPLLDELGLDLAMRNYVEGFSRRSGIQIDLDLPDLQPLSREVELAIFRIVQESLANIHRHSGSSTATITLGRQNGEVMLQISDGGCGIPLELLANQDGARRSGVGLAGIRERIRQLKGQCEIESSSRGTTIKISLPAVAIEDQSVA